MKYLKLSEVSYSYGLLHLTFLHLCDLANFHGLIHGVSRSLAVLGGVLGLGGALGRALDGEHGGVQGGTLDIAVNGGLGGVVGLGGVLGGGLGVLTAELGGKMGLLCELGELGALGKIGSLCTLIT